MSMVVDRRWTNLPDPRRFRVSAAELRFLVPALEVCFFILLASACAAALDRDRTIAQFAHTSWGSNDRAPTAVTALAQSVDGYLWVGGPDGLYRFDGVVFERYQPESGGLFPARTVSSLLTLPNGDIWIGFWPGAISLLRNGNVTNFSSRDGLPEARISGFVQDREGTIWAATSRGLLRLEGNRWKRVTHEWNFPEGSANAI